MTILIKPSSKQGGFNLIELLLVLGIIGLLIRFLLPDYSHHVAQAKRLIAETTLMKLAGYMETFYVEHHTYEGATLALFQVHDTSMDNDYQMSISSQTATDFELAAIPTRQQMQKDTTCGTLKLSSRGNRRITGSGEVADCW